MGGDTRFYDGSGRLELAVRISGSTAAAASGPAATARRTCDGHWSYDDAGRVAGYEEDGTEAMDAPVRRRDRRTQSTTFDARLRRDRGASRVALYSDARAGSRPTLIRGG